MEGGEYRRPQCHGQTLEVKNMRGDAGNEGLLYGVSILGIVVGKFRVLSFWICVH